MKISINPPVYYKESKDTPLVRLTTYDHETQMFETWQDNIKLPWVDLHAEEIKGYNMSLYVHDLMLPPETEEQKEKCRLNKVDALMSLIRVGIENVWFLPKRERNNQL